MEPGDQLRIPTALCVLIFNTCLKLPRFWRTLQYNDFKEQQVGKALGRVPDEQYRMFMKKMTPMHIYGKPQ